MGIHNLPAKHISHQCTTCAIGKSEKQPFFTYTFAYTHPLELIHIDLRGPAACSSNDKRYYLSIVDAYMRHIWIYFMQKKSYGGFTIWIYFMPNYLWNSTG